MTETTKLMSENSIKDIQDFSSRYHSLDKLRKKEKTFITKNKIFGEIYDYKENELISLMKNISQKIKEYDTVPGPDPCRPASRPRTSAGPSRRS